MPYLGGSGPGGSGSAYARPAPPPPPPRAPVPRAPGQSGQVYTPPAPPPVARPLGQSHEVYTPPPTRPSLGAAVGRAVSRTATAVSHPLVQASSRTTQRLAMALASRGGERAVPMTRQTQQELIGLYSGADRAFRFPLDQVMHGPPPSLPRNLAVQAQFNQDFANLQKQGLIPAGARQPRLNFLASGQGAGPEHDLSYAHNGQVYVSPFAAVSAVDPRSFAHGYGQEVLIHELAHTMQSPQTLSSVPIREGGAQAYADAAAPAVVGPIPENDTNYTGYVNQVRNALGPAFFMSGQFNAPTQYAGNVPPRQRRRQQ